MKFLLDKNQLKGLSEDEKKDVEDKALSTFLMGSIFGGQGISSGYQAVQNLVPNLQKQKQQQGLLAELAGIQRDVFPTQQQQQQAQSETINTYLGREKTASSPYALSESLGAPQERVEPQYTNQPVNLDAAYSRLGRLATNPAGAQMVPALSSILKDIRPEFVDGMRVNRNTGEILGSLPKVDVKSGTVVTSTMRGGQPQFQANVLEGAKEAEAFNTLPGLEKGQEYLFDANRRVVGVRDATGAIQSLVAREAAQTGAREANIPREITTSSGAKAFTFVTPPSMRQQGGATTGGTQGATGQNVAGQGAPMQGGGGGGGVQGGSLTTAQAALNASYEPILKDAYAGYKVASQRSGTLQQLQTALNNPNFDTNAFAPAKTAITSFLNASGVTGDNAKQYLTSAASMRQGLNTLASQSVSELPGAISNFEIGFAQNRFGTITDPKDSNKYAIALMQAADQRKKEYYNFVSNPRNAGPDVVQKWENSPQGRKSLFEAPALRQYLPTRLIDKGPDKGKKAYILPNGDAVLFN
jgi:hypothetical protein